MSTFTKSLIAATLAVAVAGPAAAEVNENGYFKGTNTNAQVNPNGCKKVSIDLALAELEFQSTDSQTESGFWDLTVSDQIGVFNEISGRYIERKIGKDLTGSLDTSDLGECRLDAGDRLCDGIVAVIVDVVESSDCGGSMSIEQSQAFTVTKGNVKLSNKGDRAKVDFRIEGEYTTDKDKVKKVTATIKGSKMDFVADPS